MKGSTGWAKGGVGALVHPIDTSSVRSSPPRRQTQHVHTWPACLGTPTPCTDTHPAPSCAHSPLSHRSAAAGTVTPHSTSTARCVPVHTHMSTIGRCVQRGVDTAASCSQPPFLAPWMIGLWGCCGPPWIEPGLSPVARA